jgi:hypothetical protein
MCNTLNRTQECTATSSHLPITRDLCLHFLLVCPYVLSLSPLPWPPFAPMYPSIDLFLETMGRAHVQGAFCCPNKA